jgi:predicted nucleotidyltransferase
VKIDAPTRNAVRQFAERAAAAYDVDHVVLYGSRARGTHRPSSDADVAVLLRGEPARFLPVKLALADIAFDVLIETGIDISPLPVWQQEWAHPDAYVNPALLRNIAREGVRL